MIDLRQGDCLERMKDMEDNTVDFILTDPPYELGFMGKKWDGTGIAFDVNMWKEAFRVLKPGGYLMAFGGSRTYHRMAIAIEDAGFTIKDCPVWINGAGFPKSLDISKALDKKLGAEREVVKNVEVTSSRSTDNVFYNQDRSNGGGCGFKKNFNITAPASDIAKQYAGYKTALKPAVEFITLAIKPLSEKNYAENVLKWGTGGLNIDDCRIAAIDEQSFLKNWTNRKAAAGFHGDYSGIYGSGKTNECSKYTPSGRYPANLIIHENIAPLLDSQSGILKSGAMNGVYKNTIYKNQRGTRDGKEIHLKQEANQGGASRFFKNIEEDKDYIPFIYHSKSSKKDRNMNVNGEQITGNNHATIKPLGLLKYLLTLCLPPYNAVVLDMFGGSGSTGVALEQLNQETGYNHKCILIEKEEEHCQIIKKRCCL